MNTKKIIKRYQKMGLKTKHAFDKPREIYKPHSHGEVRLYSLNGSIKIRKDEKAWEDIKPGQEVVIKRGQIHEAVVGPDGWEYIFVWDEEEAKKYGNGM